jgi:hypothetical protein
LARVDLKDNDGSTKRLQMNLKIKLNEVKTRENLPFFLFPFFVFAFFPFIFFFEYHVSLSPPT